MARRTEAREAAFQVIYQNDLNPRDEPEAYRALLVKQLDDPKLTEFACALVEGVKRHGEQLDEQIGRVAENWSLERMAATDRNLIRLGAFEILYTDTPDPVAIDETIGLAKRFGSAQSAKFVNGVLDRLMHGKAKAESNPQSTIHNPES